MVCVKMMPENVCHCGICNEGVTSCDKIIQCEGNCFGLVHLSCLVLKKSKKKSPENFKRLFWRCKECTPSKEELQSSRGVLGTKSDMGALLLQESKAGNAENVKRLIGLGAPYTFDWIGTSPLHWAAFYNHIDVAELLIRSGVSLGRNKVDRTPLHIAAQKGNCEIARMLLAFTDPNATDMLNMTPLHWACVNGNKDLVSLLLNHGASMDLPNKFGKLPAEIAVDYSHQEVINVLEEMKTLSSQEKSARLLKTRMEANKLRITLRTRSRRRDILEVLEQRSQNATCHSRIDKFYLNQDLLKAEVDKILQLSDEISKDGTDVNYSKHSNVRNGGLTISGAGKSAMDSSKITVKIPTQTLPSNMLHIPKVNGNKSNLAFKCLHVKKIIQVKADELIKMAKERTAVTKPTPAVSTDFCFQGKFFSNKEELLSCVKIKLTHLENQAEKLKSLLDKRESEMILLQKKLKTFSNGINASPVKINSFSTSNKMNNSLNNIKLSDIYSSKEKISPLIKRRSEPMSMSVDEL